MPKIEQKSYATNEIKENQPSEEILRLIEIANLVPEDAEIKGLIEFLESLDINETKELSLLTGESFRKKVEADGFLKKWLQTLKPFPDLHAWLMQCPPHIRRPDIHNLRFRFQEFTYIRTRINEIADYSEIYRKQKGKVFGNSSLVPSAELSVDENGKLSISVDRIIEKVLDFEVARFKRCENCRKIIWAYRLNRQYCDKKCSNAFHQKKIRANPKRNNEINEQRRANRERKKAAEKIKLEKMKNGTL